MALVIAWWLSLGLCALLAAVCLHTYLDGRGQRKALAALQARVAQQDAALGQLGRAVALLGTAAATLPGELAPVVAAGATTSQRAALVPILPRLPVPAAGSSSKARAKDERTTVAAPRRLTEVEAQRLLDSLPAPGRSNMTLAEHIREHFTGLIRDAKKTVDVEHCNNGHSCHGAARDLCACPCVACDRRRTLLTQAQRMWGLPHAVRMWGEPREAWALQSGARSLTIALRFDALREAAEARGLPVDHCAGRACKAAGGCACACDACVRLRSFLARAERPPSILAEEEAALSADDLARADALAVKLGLTQKEAIGLCLVAWGAESP